MGNFFHWISDHWGTISSVAAVLAEGYLAGNPNTPYAGIARSLLGQRNTFVGPK